MKHPALRPAAAAFAAALVITLVVGLGAIEGPDLAAGDLLYQRSRAREGNIFLVNIDDRALERYGPFSSWSRSLFADAVRALNAGEERPAVIGIDVLFSGASDPASDSALAEAAREYGNVLAASSAEFGAGGVLTSDGEYIADNFSVLGYSGPYPALAEAASVGHVNAMPDGDGRLRHHMLFLTTPDGERVPSFALAAANMYREYHGGESVREPKTGRLGFWYLPFSGTPGAYSENVSFADLLDGKVDPARYAGKIVLIGAYSAGLGDSYITSIDHAEPMFGVELQANAIEALLREDYRQAAGDAPQLAALFVLMFLAVLGFWRHRIVFSTALLAALCGGWLLFSRVMYDAGGPVLHALWVPAAAVPAYAVCLALNYVRAALEARKVTVTFKRYVAPEIVSELLKTPGALELGGKLTDIAVLFVDVRGFTSMSELLEPEEVVQILNRYLTLISDCILRNGGTLDKFIGDAAMAFWGAPLPLEDPVLPAARAAMDMTEGAKALSDELTARFGRTVSFGVGIHVGPAVVGNIGSPDRLDYTAIGDTVNTASRLEANAPGGTVYISRAVADALGERGETTPLGKITLKGKKDGFEVLTLDRLVRR